MVIRWIFHTLVNCFSINRLEGNSWRLIYSISDAMTSCLLNIRRHNRTNNTTADKDIEQGNTNNINESETIPSNPDTVLFMNSKENERVILNTTLPKIYSIIKKNQY